MGEEDCGGFAGADYELDDGGAEVAGGFRVSVLARAG